VVPRHAMTICRGPANKPLPYLIREPTSVLYLSRNPTTCTYFQWRPAATAAQTPRIGYSRHRAPGCPKANIDRQVGTCIERWKRAANLRQNKVLYCLSSRGCFGAPAAPRTLPLGQSCTKYPWIARPPIVFARVLERRSEQSRTSSSAKPLSHTDHGHRHVTCTGSSK
jgi:hypothetical protein